MRALGPFVWVMMLLLPPALWGQQPITFDTVRFNTVGRFAVGHSVDETSNGYRTFSNQKGLDTLSQDIFVTEFGPDGALLSERTFRTYQQDWFGYSSTMQKVANGYYAGVGRFGVLGPLDSLFLYRFKNDGDTAWTKFIAVDTTLTMRGTALESDQDVLLCGRHDPGREAYVYHLDSIGNIKGFHGYPWFDAEDVAIGPTDRWYLAGIGNHTGNYSRNVVVGSDTNGVELWRFTDLTQYGYTKGLVPLMGGAVVAVGTAGQRDDLLELAYAEDVQASAHAWAVSMAIGETDSLPQVYLPLAYRSASFAPKPTQSSAAQTLLQALPNPSPGQVLLTYPKEFTEGTITVLDLQGKIVAQHSITGHRAMLELDLEHLSPGLYIARLEAEGIPVGEVKISLVK